MLEISERSEMEDNQNGHDLYRKVTRHGDDGGCRLKI